MVLVDETSERIPLTIGDFDREKGTITLMVQAVGNTTRHLCEDFAQGDEIQHILGPLGQPSEMGRFGTVVMVCGASVWRRSIPSPGPTTNWATR